MNAETTRGALRSAIEARTAAARKLAAAQFAVQRAEAVAATAAAELERAERAAARVRKGAASSLAAALRRGVAAVAKAPEPTAERSAAEAQHAIAISALQELTAERDAAANEHRTAESDASSAACAALLEEGQRLVGELDAVQKHARALAMRLRGLGGMALPGENRPRLYPANAAAVLENPEPQIIPGEGNPISVAGALWRSWFERLLTDADADAPFDRVAATRAVAAE